MEVSIRLVVPELPSVAERCPHRAVTLGDLNGTVQAFAIDTRSGERRPVTDRPQGTARYAIEPDGERVWWFDDDAHGVGRWRVQPFTGGPDTDALPGTAIGRQAGLAMALDGTVAAGVTDGDDLLVYLRAPGGPSRQVARIAGHAELADVSADGDLVAVCTEPDAPDAVRILRPDGGTTAVLSGTGGQVWGLGFRPVPGPAAFLCVIERDGVYRPAVWTAADGLVAVPGPGFDTEITASWFPDGRRLLVRQHRHARSVLIALDPADGSRRTVPTETGSVLDAAVQPDGILRYVWTRGGRAPEIRTDPPTDAGGAGGRADREPDTDLWVPGPGGPVHVLLTPATAPGRRPAVFLLHGGPFRAAMDAYDPTVEVLRNIGFTVVRVNYRGSPGYGAAWRTEFDAGVGHTQVADIVAVHRYLVDSGTVDPARVCVAGESWGGYLALLAAGTRPELWCGVAAVNPVADYALAFRDTTPAVRALDVHLFGGNPDEMPDAYRRASPATYASAVRAPVLIVAGRDDVKCPPAQISSYADEVRRHGRDDIVVLWTGHGHDAYDVSGRVGILSAVVRHLGLAAGGRPERAPAAVGG